MVKYIRLDKKKAREEDNMTVDSVITLDNDVNCLLLEKVNFETDNYFLSVVLNEDEEPSDEYVIFKEIIENNENYVEAVADQSSNRVFYI